MVQRIRFADVLKPLWPLLPEPPLLPNESQLDYNRICAALDNDVKPHGIIQQIYVADIANLTWDSLRLRRWKVAIIKSQIPAALASLLDQLLRQSGDPQPGDWLHMITAEAENLSKAWFADPKAESRVAELLHKFQLDETAIEAEAYRRSASDLERLDRMLASCESRRAKALRNIAESDVIFERRLQESSDRIINGQTPVLTYKAAENPTTSTSTPTSVSTPPSAPPPQ